MSRSPRAILFYIANGFSASTLLVHAARLISRLI